MPLDDLMSSNNRVHPRSVREGSALTAAGVYTENFLLVSEFIPSPSTIFFPSFFLWYHSTEFVSLRKNTITTFVCRRTESKLFKRGGRRKKFFFLFFFCGSRFHVAYVSFSFLFLLCSSFSFLILFFIFIFYFFSFPLPSSSSSSFFALFFFLFSFFLFLLLFPLRPSLLPFQLTSLLLFFFSPIRLQFLFLPFFFSF